jgi:hypothetical protein
MKLPLFTVPISRKLILGALAGAVGAGLQALGVYSVSPQLQGWISTGEFLLVGWAVPEAIPFLRWAVRRVNLPMEFKESA